MKALKLLVITTLFAWAGLAQAGTACPGSYDDNVLLTPTGTTEAQCETGSQNNDSPQPAQVNDDAMFTYTNWMTILKDDTTGDGFSFPDTGIGGTGALQSGTFTIDASVWNTYSTLMIVLKATGNYVGYLIKAGTTSVSYSSPFINSQERTQNISHITFYGIKGGQQVPEPTTLALLGLGLMGAGMARRRKAQA